ncbi:protease pro-enzyme activation domain-containing protein [Rhodanobacter sp. L36]|uniref:S53 family peptidase n=1 Tax=Rhodanobacter sp. L36 TaxID=1747221 RepID=UPI00131D7DBB|nr:protease pro-enzyme activation domain-containing protein [Rhodanobacter sp. L36]
MKQHSFILGAAIAAALSGAPGLLQAQATASVSASLGIKEAPRVTQTVSNSQLATIAQTRSRVVGQALSSTSLSGSAAMKHLQLVLKRSPLRTAELEAHIAAQHNPQSNQFHQWLTPQQFGDSYGVVDGDVAAITSWLTAQGFTVSGVYPNKMQIDFSGSVAQVNQAFHTQETVYKLKDGTRYLGNDGDISVPVALHDVIAGVVGLSEAPAIKAAAPSAGKWNAATHRFDLTGAAASQAHAMTIGSGGLRGTRGLVPDDLANMYGISRIRQNGVSGTGITIAVVEITPALPDDWSNYVTQFNLGSYGGSFSQITPQIGTLNNCYAGQESDPPNESFSAAEDLEAATAIAPGAHIEVAYCSNYTSTFDPASPNTYGGTFIALTNLVNADERPNVVSVTYPGYYHGEDKTDTASKTALDVVTAQADAEGISVFTDTGGSGSNSDFTGGQINAAGQTVAALASSPYVTAVGGTDLADELDGTTSQYFSSTPNANYGTALGYVPEIPWNASCGNGVVAKADGFSSAVGFCQFLMGRDPNASYTTSIASGSGSSVVDSKPTWQRLVYNAPKDQSRDVPDVSLFGGSYANNTAMVICLGGYECTPNFTTPAFLVTNSSLASPMFAGIQALIDQGIAMRGLPANQGNAAPTLYALAQQEYGGASGAVPASLAACSADNGNNGTSSCVFHNITRGSTSTQCVSFDGGADTPNCYFYGAVNPYGYGVETEGLTTTDAAPTAYGVNNKAYGAGPGWNFASGLGSVNVTNLLIAWRAFVHAPAAAPQ